LNFSKSDTSFSSSSTKIAKLDLSSTESRASLAISSPDYPVVAGDVYSLSYATASALIESQLIVDADYSINMGALGTLQAKGMLFQKVKAAIEKKVADSFPYSGPRLVITKCGVFPVYVQGEVRQASIQYAWGLSRLSDLQVTTTPYTSFRAIKINDKDGVTRAFDLYKRLRDGDVGQDPLLRPFDTITFEKNMRTIELSGEVRRPGRYQLLQGEELGDLIDSYGDGLNEMSLPGHITVARVSPRDPKATDFFNLDGDSSAHFHLENLDTVYIFSKLDYLPAVYFEGAVSSVDLSQNTAASVQDSDQGGGTATAVSNTSSSKSGDVEISNRIKYSFYEGEMLSNAIQRINKSFTAVSDLEDSYVIRGSSGAKVMINIRKLISREDLSQDLRLENNDYVIIPFRQYFITVGGAVALPGRYPYVPDRTWKYYINLAGGIDNDRNNWGVVDVTDKNDKKKSGDSIIQPEDKIFVPSIGIWYFLSRLATIASIISAIGTGIYYIFLSNSYLHFWP
jgi:Periplasmic protein involved in polysaccharide export